MCLEPNRRSVYLLRWPDRAYLGVWTGGGCLA